MASKFLTTMGILALSMQLNGCSREVSFAQDVKPILEESCIQCHGELGEGVAVSDFSVVDYDSVMKGTKFGPVIVPGSSVSSSMYLVIAHKTSAEIHMPPHHEKALAEGRAESLSDDQISIVADWIDQGAKNN